MTPLNAIPQPAQPLPTDAPAPRFFLDAAFDANPDDGDWWLDIGAVDLPGSLAA